MGARVPIGEQPPASTTLVMYVLSAQRPAPLAEGEATPLLYHQPSGQPGIICCTVSVVQASRRWLSVYKECVEPRVGQITLHLRGELDLIKHREEHLNLTSKRDVRE